MSCNYFSSKMLNSKHLCRTYAGNSVIFRDSSVFAINSNGER
jgi:hypothetical protein